MSWLGDFLDQRNNEAKSIFGGVPGANKAIDINSSVGLHPLSFQTGGLLGGNQGVINWGGDNGTDKGTGAITTNGLSGINTGEKKNQNIAEAIALYLGGSALMGSGSGSGTAGATDMGYIPQEGYQVGGGSGTVTPAGATDMGYLDTPGYTPSATGTGSSSGGIFKNIGRAGNVMSMLGGGSGNTDQPQSQPKTNQGIGVAPDQNSPTYTAAMSGQVNRMGTPTDAPVAPPVNTPQTNTPQVPMTALQAKVASMGTGQKIMAGMGEFGAALNGRPSPLNSQIANDQAALQNNITSFNEGMNVLGKLPPGDQRDQFVQSMAPQMGKMQPAFESLAKMPDGQRQLMMSYYQDSPTLQDLMKRDPSSNLAMKFFNSPNGIAHVQAEAEQNKSGLVATKVATLVEQAQTIDPNIAAQIQTQGYTTPRQIQQLSDKASTMDTAHSKFALTPADQFVLSGDKADHVYSLAGTMNSKGMDAINVKQAENDNATTPFMKEAAALYGKGTPEYNAAAKAHIAKMDAPSSVTINPPPTINPANRNLHGQEYLDTLLPVAQNTVKGLTDYTVDPKNLSLRNGERAAYIAQAKQADPNYDPSQFGIRNKVVQGFTSGVEARNVTSLNTAIAHAGTLKELFDAQANGDIPLVNQIVNNIKANLGKADVTNPKGAVQAVSTELMRAFRGSGVGSEKEIQAWHDTLPTNGSPDQQNGPLGTVVGLLNGRITALNDQYNRGTSKTTGFPNLLSPKSQAVLAKLGGNSAPTFATEADAKAANLTSGTKIIINGQSGTWH